MNLVVLDGVSAYLSLDRSRTGLPTSLPGGVHQTSGGMLQSVNINGLLPKESLTLQNVHQATVQCIRQWQMKHKVAVITTVSAALLPDVWPVTPREVLPHCWKVCCS